LHFFIGSNSGGGTGSSSSNNVDASGHLDLVRPNERNEYDVADGISAGCFRVVMVFPGKPIFFHFKMI
jgi:hypothetical protein